MIVTVATLGDSVMFGSEELSRICRLSDGELSHILSSATRRERGRDRCSSVSWKVRDDAK